MNWKKFIIFNKIICVVISIILTFYWSYKYSKNEDTSLLNYKWYAESAAKDEYPVLSFCFRNPFLKDKLKEFGVTDERKYLEFLEGKTFPSNFSSIPYDDITLQLENYLIGYYLYFVNGTERNLTVLEGRNFVETSTSYNGFIQQRFFKCFSFKLKKIQRIRTLALRLKQDIFQNHSRAAYYFFVTLIHYPNQLLRSFGSIKRIWNDRRNNTAEYAMWFTVNGMEVTNRRNKKSSSCIENWKNYDNILLENHVTNVGCNAPYQKYINTTIPTCENREDMKLVKLGPDQDEEVGLQPPCRSVEKI